ASNPKTTFNQFDTIRIRASDPVDPDDEDNTNLTYRWNIDGVPVDGGQALEWTFSGGGTHAVTLSVTDPFAAFATTGRTMNVNNLQSEIDGNLPTDPTTGNPTVTIQTDSQVAADTFMAMFDPSALG